ncbi:ParB N-terminal domain-containing protein [Stenotrophomonas maltophilia]|nr:ParB N-terminal domain-containing protein [Stenotrophomonas maltophilia]
MRRARQEQAASPARRRAQPWRARSFSSTPSSYEIVAGERRWRASQLAGQFGGQGQQRTGMPHFQAAGFQQQADRHW